MNFLSSETFLLVSRFRDTLCCQDGKPHRASQSLNFFHDLGLSRNWTKILKHAAL